MQARRDRALPGGRAIVGRGTACHTADPERAPQVAVPLLQLGDGDRASGASLPAIARWHGGAARCAVRGIHPLNQQDNPHTPPATDMPMGVVARLVQKTATRTCRPCNEGGRGQQRRLRQPICAALPSAAAKLLGDVSCVGDCHGNPGSSNSRIRSRLRAIYPFSLGFCALCREWISNWDRSLDVWERCEGLQIVVGLHYQP